MCQKIWAGVSPFLPIPKLTQYIQFVKSQQKIWAGPPPSIGQNPEEQLHFIWETFPNTHEGFMMKQMQEDLILFG